MTIDRSKVQHMNPNNLLFQTDGYKWTHWKQYPEGTTGVFSYLEAREGAQHPETVFFGLQPLLRRLAGCVVTQHDITEAGVVANAYFGDPALFNYAGWQHIVDKHGGSLPVRIKAVPEGTPVPVGNVLMTVENTDPECYWLTNTLESLLLHAWYPTTVATVSYNVKKYLKAKLEEAGAPLDGLPFMLHDFGYRGVSGNEAAAAGGLGHLVNFLGSDTLLPILLAGNDYAADPKTVAFSVPATEHSVMTSNGPAGEMQIVGDLLDAYPNGVLSVVADSYDIYSFVNEVGTTFRERILARDGVFVVRPDSVTPDHKTPEALVEHILLRLWSTFSGTINAKGYRVLDPHVRVLWGDGIDPAGIERIVDTAMAAGFSPENLVFGMGGGLLQKVNRDTERFAFKCSAQQRGGVWHDVYKEPLGGNKPSKRGRLRLQRDTSGGYETVNELEAASSHVANDAVLQTVFENGRLYNQTTFEEVRARASL